MNRRSRDILKCFLPAILMFAVQNAMAIMTMEILSAIVFAKGGGLEELLDAAASPGFNAVVLIEYSVICLVIFWFWYKKLKTRIESEVSIPDNKLTLLICPGVAFLVVGCQVVGNYIVSTVSLMFPELLKIYEDILKTAGLSEDQMGIQLILYAVILGPIVEELGFRGLCFNYAKRGMSFAAANLVQALIFAGFHFNIMQAAYALPFGLIMGYVYHKTGSLKVVIVIHILFNGFSSAFGGVDYMGGSPVSFFIVLLSGMMAVYLGLKLISKSVKQRSAE